MSGGDQKKFLSRKCPANKTFLIYPKITLNTSDDSNFIKFMT